MGNSNTAFLQLDNTVCAPGDVLRGQLHVSLVSPVTCVAVYVKVKARETASWTSHNVLYTGDEEWFNISLRLSDERIEAMKGSFSYPFTFKLPDNLPGSFETAGFTSRVSASLKYQVKGVVSLEGGLFGKRIRAASEITIIANPLGIYRVVCVTSKAIRRLLVSKTGTVNMTLQTDKDVYYTGDTITAYATIHNDTSHPIDSLTLQLHSSVRVSSGAAFWINKKLIAEQSFPGLRSGEIAERMQFTITVPNGVSLSTYTLLFSHYYTVTLVAAVPLASNPKCTVPVGVYARLPTSPVPLEPKLPKGWHATIGHPVNSCSDILLGLPALDMSIFTDLAVLP